jgi:hypothetical protein
VHQIEGSDNQPDHFAETTYEVEDLSGRVPDSEFEPLGRAGDTVVKGDSTYQVAADGTLQRIGAATPTYGFKPNSGNAPSASRAAGIPPATTAGLAIAFVVAGAAGAIAIVRSRRRPPPDWGPPRQKP